MEQEFITDVSTRTFPDQSLSDPEMYHIAQLGTEWEHLEFDTPMLQKRAQLERKLRANADYHIGCGGLNIRPGQENVVIDSVIWAMEILAKYGHCLRFDQCDY